MTNGRMLPVESGIECGEYLFERRNTYDKQLLESVSGLGSSIDHGCGFWRYSRECASADVFPG
jgi:hypothetical protein